MQNDNNPRFFRLIWAKKSGIWLRKKKKSARGQQKKTSVLRLPSLPRIIQFVKKKKTV